MQVVALIHETNEVYSASFPDFPGCTATAIDPDDIMAKATDVLAQHIRFMIDNGCEWPQPRSLSRLADDPVFLTASAGAMIALIPYTPGTRGVRLTITIDEALLASIDRAAEAVRETRSDYLGEAVRRRLAQDAERHDASKPPDPSLSDAPSELPVPETGTPPDAEASLKRIREMLERLDEPPFRQEHFAQLRPAKRKGI